MRSWLALIICVGISLACISLVHANAEDADASASSASQSENNQSQTNSFPINRGPNGFSSRLDANSLAIAAGVRGLHHITEESQSYCVPLPLDLSKKNKKAKTMQKLSGNSRCLALNSKTVMDIVIGGLATHFAVSQCAAQCHSFLGIQEQDSVGDAHFEALRLEIQSWHRVNRTVGMFPSAYSAVRKEDRDEVAALFKKVEGGNQNQSEAKSAPDDSEGNVRLRSNDTSSAEVASGAEPSSVGSGSTGDVLAENASTVQGSGNNVERSQSSSETDKSIAIAALNLFHARFVPQRVLKKATEYYEKRLLRHHIIRAYAIAPRDEDVSSATNIMHRVSQMWKSEGAQVAAAPMTAFLPWVSPRRNVSIKELVTRLVPTNPELLQNNTELYDDNSSSKASDVHVSIDIEGTIRKVEQMKYFEEVKRQRSGRIRMKRSTPKALRHYPTHESIPVVVELFYSTNCDICAPVVKAFDLLPHVYKRICESAHSAIASCSPVTLFFKIPQIKKFRVVPDFYVHTSRESWQSIQRDQTLGPSLDTVSLLSDMITEMVMHKVINLRVLTSEEAKDLEEKQQQHEEKEKEKEKQSISTEPTPSEEGAQSSATGEGTELNATQGSNESDPENSPVNQTSAAAAARKNAKDALLQEDVDEEEFNPRNMQVVTVQSLIETLVTLYLAESMNNSPRLSLGGLREKLLDMDSAGLSLAFRMTPLQWISLVLTVVWVCLLVRNPRSALIE